MIRIRGLRKSYGEKLVLDDVNVDAEPGAIVAVLGPSGCGKSSLLRCMNGLLPFDAGELEIAGFRLRGGAVPRASELLRLRAAVGMVFQDLHLFPHLTALENVTLAPRVVSKTPRAAAEKHARSLLELVGLTDHVNARPAALSGGQKQRVAIARAVAQGARVLLLDEPTSALDVALRNDVAALLRHLAQGDTSSDASVEPLTVVVVTHDEDFASAIGTAVWKMDRGKIVQARGGDAVGRDVL